MEKFSLFGLTFGRKRSCDSVAGGPIFANLVSKYPQDFKEKSHEAVRLKARRFCMRGKICLGGVQLGLISFFATFSSLYRTTSTIVTLNREI